MKHPLRQALDPARERNAPVLVPEKTCIREPRPQHALIARGDGLALIGGDIVGNEQEPRRRRAVRLQAGEIFLMRAHRGRQDFRRQSHVFGVDCAGQNNRKFYEAGDLVEQPGIWFEYKPLIRGGRFEILPDDLLAAFLIQYDIILAEAVQVFSRVRDANLAR